MTIFFEPLPSAVPYVPGLKSQEYAPLAEILEDPTMRRTKGGSRYLVGRSEALGCMVAIHYQRKSKIRPATWVVRWPQTNPARLDWGGERRAVERIEDVVEMLGVAVAPAPSR